MDLYGGESPLTIPTRPPYSARRNATGRQALAELRRLLGLLRADDNRITLAPQPGLVRLPELVDQVRAAGAPVELTLHGSPSALSPGLDLTAYRIIQEALTNVVKHAGCSPTRIAIIYRPRRLELVVEDDGPSQSAGDGAGHGLVGMRERVALYAGALTVGPRDGGGFTVRASLPIEEPAA